MYILRNLPKISLHLRFIQLVFFPFSDLDKILELTLDGTPVDLPSIESVVILNIPCWGAGVRKFILLFKLMLVFFIIILCLSYLSHTVKPEFIGPPRENRQMLLLVIFQLSYKHGSSYKVIPYMGHYFYMF